MVWLRKPNIGFRGSMRRTSIVLACWFVTALSGTAGAACPQQESLANVQAHVFSDGSIAMATPLAVNPDGAQRSYSMGDHGFTYIVNGVDLWDGKNRLSCQDAVRRIICRQKWLEAESKGFAKGTAQFYSYAIEGEAMDGGTLKPFKKGAFLLGDGVGRPRVSGNEKTVTGNDLAVYRSMTALTHEIESKTAYLDSSSIPTLVSPRTSSVSIGQVAWLRMSDNSPGIFAVVGDIGPKFGEASIALHQLLRDGKLTHQDLGPMPKEARCGAAEKALRPPFNAGLDVKNDTCKKTNDHPTGGADIRAYTGIGTPVEVLILGAARLPVSGNRVTGEVTLARLEQVATDAGYTPEKLQEMAGCLP